jgi:2-amino-4-hydroxy-6-hydroxymethyldihydropteridine diphosphokinase
MSIAYLSLGSNLGDRLANLITALRLLGAPTAPTRLVGISSVWETTPQGKVDQPDFLNLGAAVETNLSPEALLDFCLAVEAEMGRVRIERWGPRIIDIDLCWYDDLTVRTERLEVPHPRLAERAFMLVPLLELAPNPRWQTWLDQLPDQGLRPFLSAEALRALL